VIFATASALGFSLLVLALIGLPILGLTLRGRDAVRHGRAGPGSA